MMATTHALVGIGIAALASLVVPEITVPVVIAAGIGGVFPDLDLYAGHRETLHYPVYYVWLAAPAVVLALAIGSALVWALTLFVVAAGIHSLMDAAGGGLELRPWRGTSDRAVYSHYHGRWLRPRRLVRYDGAPEDLVLGGVVAVPSLLLFDGHLALAVWALLGVSMIYVVVRKPMVAVAEWLFERVPTPVRRRLPDRFLEEAAPVDTKP